MRSTFAAALLCLVLSFSREVAANDAAYYGDGATVFAMEEGRVRMEREVIRIRYDAKAQRYVADCRFTFVNTSDEVVEVQMGFPDWLEHSEEGGEWAIRDFRVWVRGRAAKPEHKKVEREDYQGAYTWRVRFEPRQRMEVRNRYVFGGLSTNGPPDACLHDIPEAEKARAWWLHAPDRAGGWKFSDALCRRVRYIVTTGKTWGGTIGEADIRIQLPPDTLPHLAQAIPAATSVTPREVRWHFRDFDPEQELDVVLLVPYPPESEEYAEGDRPLLETPEQVRAWGDVAAASGTQPAVVDGLLRRYPRSKPKAGRYAEVVAALRELRTRLRSP